MGGQRIKSLPINEFRNINSVPKNDQLSIKIINVDFIISDILVKYIKNCPILF